MKFNRVIKYDNLWELFYKNAKIYNEYDCFITVKDSTILASTYDTVFDNVKRLSSLFVNSGLKKTDKLVLYMDNSTEWIEIFMACILLGIIVVPISPKFSRSAINQIIKETIPKAIFLKSEYNLKLNYAFQNIFYLENFNSYLKGQEPITIRDFAKKISKDDIIEIFYDTNNKNKLYGIVVSHKNLTTNIYNLMLVLPIMQYQNIIQTMSLHTRIAQTLSFGILSLGKRQIFLDKVDPDFIKNCNFLFNIEVVLATPSVLFVMIKMIRELLTQRRLLYTAKIFKGIIKFLPKRIRKIIFISNELYRDLQVIVSPTLELSQGNLEWLYNAGLDIYQTYGTTESGQLTLGQSNYIEPLSVGTPLPNQMIKIINNEICIRGDNVFTRYVREDKSSYNSKSKDGWYITGEKGSMRKNSLFVYGKDREEIILKNKEKIFAKFIEQKINSYKCINDSYILKYKHHLIVVLITSMNHKYIQKILRNINKHLNKDAFISNFYIWDDEFLPIDELGRINQLKIKNKIKKYF